jgi:hypothetical protein
VPLVGLAWLALGPGPAAATPSQITLVPTPPAVSGGGPVTLSGQVSGAAPGTVVDLSASAYPYRSSRPLAAVPVAANGSYSVVVHPDRNVRYTAAVSGGGAQTTAGVTVTDRVITRVRALTLGRAMVTLLVFHPGDLHWNGVTVRWTFGRTRNGRFATARPTRSRRLGPHITILRTIIALPAGRFSFRACFRPPADNALADPEAVPGCAGRGYRGGGRLPAGFPGTRAIARAERYLAGRAGVTGLAVVDSEGRLSGVHLHRTFITASVIKAMLLVAYLRRLNALAQRRVDPASRAFLYPMIHLSDNTAASHCWAILGNGALYSLARAAGMTNFSISTDWASARLSPADQAAFFFKMDSLIPRQFVGYARFLLSTIAGYESWGIPAVAGPLGYRVFFKGGWRTTELGQLVHQMARLEGHGHTFSMAVMTDGDPSMSYGIDTIQGVAGALLR